MPTGKVGSQGSRGLSSAPPPLVGIIYAHGVCSYVCAYDAACSQGLSPHRGAGPAGQPSALVPRGAASQDWNPCWGNSMRPHMPRSLGVCSGEQGLLDTETQGHTVTRREKSGPSSPCGLAFAPNAENGHSCFKRTSLLNMQIMESHAFPWRI